eukprot:1159456_1
MSNTVTISAKKIQRFSDALRIIPIKKAIRANESESEETCDQECDDPIAGCMQLKRLVVALMYYGQLDVQNSAHAQAIFLAFIREVYKDILDDYTHLVKKHNNLEDINNALKEEKVF